MGESVRQTGSLDPFRMTEIEYVKSDIRDKIIDKGWLENLRLKCKEYIKNNGTKTTTVDEILDVISDEAFTTFPKDIMLELIEDIRNNRE